MFDRISNYSLNETMAYNICCNVLALEKLAKMWYHLLLIHPKFNIFFTSIFIY